MAGTGDSQSDDSKSAPGIESREARPAEAPAPDAKREREREPHPGEIYFIEREAIELRRVRWVLHRESEQRAEKAPAAQRRGRESRARQHPTASDVLERYQRPPSDDSSESKGIVANALSWLRQSLRGK